PHQSQSQLQFLLLFHGYQYQASLVHQVANLAHNSETVDIQPVFVFRSPYAQCPTLSNQHLYPQQQMSCRQIAPDAATVTMLAHSRMTSDERYLGHGVSENSK